MCENLFKTRRNHPGRARRADVARRERLSCASVANAPAWPAREPPPSLSFARPRASRGSRTLSPVRGRSSRCSPRPRPSRRSRVRLSPPVPRASARGVEADGSRRRGRTLASRGTKTRRAGVSPGEQKDSAFHRSTGRVSPSPIPRSRIVRALRTADIRGSATLYWRVARIRSTPLLLSSPPARRSAVNFLRARVARRAPRRVVVRAGSRLGMVASGRSDAELYAFGRRRARAAPGCGVGGERRAHAHERERAGEPPGRRARGVRAARAGASAPRRPMGRHHASTQPERDARRARRPRGPLRRVVRRPRERREGGVRGEARARPRRGVSPPLL